VGAPLVQGGVDAVAHPVGLLVGQGPLQVAQDDPDQDVLLARAQAEAGHRLGREPVVRRLGQDGHLLDGVGVPAEGVTDPVAQVLHGVVGGHGHRQVAPHRRHRRHRPVGGKVGHLAGDPRVGRAQQPDVGDALAQHQQPVQAHAEGQAAPAGQAGRLQHRRVGQAALPDLDPLAVPADVHLAPVQGVGVDARL
jgi:hypothetical protein